MIRALDASRPEDRSEWLEAWEACGRETFAHPDFVELFVDPGGEALALLSRQSSGSALLPLLRRPLPKPLASAIPGHWDTDAISPYGYGGPYTSGYVDWPAFYRDVLDWMRQERVVTCFVRTSLDNVTELDEDVDGYRAVVLADNVRVDLRREPDAQWRHYAHKVRKNVNKALRAGLEVRLTDGFADLDSFLGIYWATMGRRGADQHYYFDESFFQRLGAIPGACLVADVLDADGRVVSAELVLTSDRNLYSFLGGTLEEAFVHAPNDLLKHRLIEYGALIEKDWFVLGGGFRPGDGIFRYKQGFDKVGVAPFVGVQLIADPAVYEELVGQRGAARPPDDAQRTFLWFPEYRAP